MTPTPTHMSIPAFDSVKVMVVGDVMLDRYWHGDTSRISPEAPVPVVRVENIEARPGGAANVAVNMASLGAHPVLIGVTGEDDAADVLVALLDDYGVDSRLVRLPDFKTVTKMRVLSRHQQLIRLDIEENPTAAPSAPTLAAFERTLGEVQGVVLSDYGKGTLAPIREMIELARAARVPVLIDPKGSDFERYRAATLVTPNLNEFEAVVGPCSTEAVLAERAERLRADLDLEALLVTRGESGMSLVRHDLPPLHLPARAREVYDVTGAGDTVIAVLGVAIGAGSDLPTAMAVANLAAGIVVGKLGTAGTTVAELEAAMHGHSDPGWGVLDRAELVAAVAQAREAGNRVVMTNGCFDILHAGHVHYLSRAKALGDRLVVAVNDDASVGRLKGKGRPINTTANRMQVLAALECVDWVVPFSEDTPASLIHEVLPDVLVKGGDWHVDDVAGGDRVRENGGRVETLDYQEGFSTTGIIEAAARIVKARGNGG